MPWSPPFDTPVLLDPRLDPFRDRVGELWDRGELRGHAVWRQEVVSELQGGKLWWRRWEPPREVVDLDWHLLSGEYGDDWIDPVSGSEGLDTEVRSWAAGRCEVGGVEYDICWLDAEAGLEVGEGVFGYLGRIDEQGELSWIV